MTALETPAPDAPGEEWGALAVRIPGFQYPSPMPRCLVDDEWGPLPDPDHWAWWGWFITLLGPERIQLTMWGNLITVGYNIDKGWKPSAFGRACIAAAAVNGRWPGGAS